MDNGEDDAERSLWFILLVNVALFLGLLLAAELGFRLVQGGEAIISGDASRKDVTVEANKTNPMRFFWTMYRPFVMFSATPMKNRKFHNLYQEDGVNHGDFVGTFPLNADGFVADHDFDFATPYVKRPNERVVLFTGGSAAWGVGATRPQTTIAGRLEHYLNQSQPYYRYTVVNLAMGSWIAFQEFIGLAYWGRSYDPDWVVVMDGVNDGTLVCGEARGAGKPMHNDTFDAYINAYLFGQLRPDFYRGRFENWLVAHSRLYARLTGKQPVQAPPYLAYITGTSPEARNKVMRDVPWTEVDRQTHFYADTQRQIVNLFPKARVILSTQPMVNDFHGHFLDVYDAPFGSPAHEAAAGRFWGLLDLVYARQKDQRCGDVLDGDNFGYFFGRIALLTEWLARDLAKEQQRVVLYENVGRLMDSAFAQRRPYFVDPVHLSEKGMDVAARRYAQMILEKDTGRPLQPDP